MRYFGLNGQLGGGEEGVQAVRVLAVFAEQLVQGFMQFDDVAWDPIGEVAVFGLVPNTFHRVEVRRVTWEPLGAEPSAASGEQVAYRGSMGREAVANEQQRSSQVIMHAAQESNDVRGASVMVQKIVIQAEAARPRSSAQGCHRCNAIVSVPGMLHGSMAALGPHATTQRLQHEATFIDKNQASLPLGALFLTAASARSASGRFRLRGAREQAALAFADSSRADVRAFRHNRGDSPRQIADESNPARAVPTTRRVRNPSAVNPGAVPPAISAVPAATTSARAPGEAWPAASAHRRAARLVSSGWRMTNCNRPPQPLSPTISPAQKAGLPHVGELRAPREFQWVSCTIIRRSPL